MVSRGSQPALARLVPDLTLESYEMTLLKAELSIAEQGSFISNRDHFDPLLPEGYLPSEVTPTFRVGGDPRLSNGKTLLQGLETAMQGITNFSTWRETNYPVTPNGGGLVEESLDDKITRYTNQNDSEKTSAMILSRGDSSHDLDDR